MPIISWVMEKVNFIRHGIGLERRDADHSKKAPDPATGDGICPGTEIYISRRGEVGIEDTFVVSGERAGTVNNTRRRRSNSVKQTLLN